MKIFDIVSRYMAIVILAVAVLAYVVPETSLWIQTKWLNYLLMVVMFGMGLTLRPVDFKVVFTRPRDVILGCVMQFTLMPVLAYLLCLVFGLHEGLMAGVILVGACPGGTSSNVITYLSRGDVPLSVGMTAVNTLIAPVVTPVIVFLCLGETISVDMWSMFLSILQVVVIPIVLGLVIAYFAADRIDRVKDGLPVVSVAAISLIVACVVSHSVHNLQTAGLTVFAVVILHNLLGYACGYGVAKLLRTSEVKCRTLSIEVGMQNSGLATSLAGTAFPGLAMASVPGAIFSVWHNISGAILASFFSSHAPEQEPVRGDSDERSDS